MLAHTHTQLHSHTRMRMRHVQPLGQRRRAHRTAAEPRRLRLSMRLPLCPSGPVHTAALQATLRSVCGTARCGTSTTTSTITITMAWAVAWTSPSRPPTSVLWLCGARTPGMPIRRHAVVAVVTVRPLAAAAMYRATRTRNRTCSPMPGRTMLGTAGTAGTAVARPQAPAPSPPRPRRCTPRRPCAGLPCSPARPKGDRSRIMIFHRHRRQPR